MCKKTYKNVDGTSFQNVTFKASVNDLTKVLGEPDNNNTGEDKVNFVWDMETRDGDVFTLYDWKFYRKLDFNEQVEWHIGSFSKSTSNVAKMEVQKQLNDLFN
jgi:hypothetical protein